MSEERRYFVYIMANASKRLYTGMTNSLRRRVREHKLKQTPGFAAEYNITRLVYFRELRRCSKRDRTREANQGLDSCQATCSRGIDES
jgi:predicted GIY-YIG superfamily endonuclease